MAATKVKRKRGEVEICFANELEPSIWRELQEGIISENMKEHIPQHLQAELLDRFVDAGYIRA